jgi:hypothetical protein
LEPCRVGERVSAVGRRIGTNGIESPTPECLGDLEVEAQEVAAIVHANILTLVELFGVKWRAELSRLE